MKLRIRLSGAARSIDVGESASCTLAELRQRTADVFQLQAPFNLSLNKMDALSGEDQTLSQLGIVPGDLLFIINGDADRASHSTTTTRSHTDTRSSEQEEALAAATSSTNASSVVMSAGLEGRMTGDRSTELNAVAESQTPEAVPSNSLMAQRVEGVSTQIADSDSCSAAAILSSYSHSQASSTNASVGLCSLSSPHREEHEVNRFLGEPLLCREATGRSVPQVLSNLYVSAGCQTPADALWVVIHAVIMEAGFRPAQDEELLMGADWNKRGFYKRMYTHICLRPEHAALACTVVGVPMGGMLLVHGMTSVEQSFQTEKQHLRVSDFVSAVQCDVHGVYCNLEQLSRTVKDLICQPLLAHLGEVCGYPVTLGLPSLSHELKLKILSYLSVDSLIRMAQVCQLFGSMYKDPWLWRNLYLREFGRNGDPSLNKNWYEIYKEEWVARREQRKASRLRHQVLTGIPPWLNPRPGHFPPLGPPPFPGGIVGGDYDLNPDFSSSIPHPLFGRPTPPGPFQPRPRFEDPFGPDSDDQLGAGAGPPPPFTLRPRFGRNTLGNLRPSSSGSFGFGRF